ncbi:hypothetical protein [Cupriavidus plantarum]|uniref:Uncharacterized protein n=1 Tax=Cupriavidus plantarum TaxID=942865 RepID=A0A316ELI8_9BURK|nr:hypothetical protein [Cupriavidus plantarum]NYI02896.1 hypothetical protein [Cupriavidus plantarum]PWK32384.1 hypothetical protein C7419_107175 [Cupriavidus plantarum]REE87184.1 hypothetical protein C7418_5242 [Cupriavidus plantarum]RLK29570.1 hypothetical protein C7417_5279 [Cupriavidus plantarum]CAG2152743.1 hypothetical protein LMG26296_05190 [Cupriavidus plantarum]
MSQFLSDHPMLVFALEAGAALFLLVFIVVWTMGTAKKNPRPTRAPDDHPSRNAGARPAAEPTEGNKGEAREP